MTWRINQTLEYFAKADRLLSNKSSNKRGKPSRDKMVHDNTKSVAPQGLAGIWQHEWVLRNMSFSVLVRMRSPVQIWIAAPKNSRNRLISGVFVLFSVKIMWVGKWVRRVDPQLDPHGEMRGNVQRVPERKFGLLLCVLSVK